MKRLIVLAWFIVLFVGCIFCQGQVQMIEGVKIDIQGYYEGFVIFKITNSSRNDAMFDLNRNQQDVIRCVHINARDKEGSLLTQNQVFSDGFWNPSALESQIVIEESYLNNLVTLTSGSTLMFKTRLNSIFTGLTVDIRTITSLQAKLIYYKGKKKKEALSPTYRLPKTAKVRYKTKNNED